MKKRLMAFFLAVVMTAGSMPQASYAASELTEEVEWEEAAEETEYTAGQPDEAECAAEEAEAEESVFAGESAQAAESVSVSFNDGGIRLVITACDNGTYSKEIPVIEDDGQISLSVNVLPPVGKVFAKDGVAAGDLTGLSVKCSADTEADGELVGIEGTEVNLVSANTAEGNAAYTPADNLIVLKGKNRGGVARVNLSIWYGVARLLNVQKEILVSAKLAAPVFICAEDNRTIKGLIPGYEYVITYEGNSVRLTADENGEIETAGAWLGKTVSVNVAAKEEYEKDSDTVSADVIRFISEKLEGRFAGPLAGDDIPESGKTDNKNVVISGIEWSVSGQKVSGGKFEAGLPYTAKVRFAISSNDIVRFTSDYMEVPGFNCTGISKNGISISVSANDASLGEAKGKAFVTTVSFDACPKEKKLEKIELTPEVFKFCVSEVEAQDEFVAAITPGNLTDTGVSMNFVSDGEISLINIGFDEDALLDTSDEAYDRGAGVLKGKLHAYGPGYGEVIADAYNKSMSANATVLIRYDTPSANVVIVRRDRNSELIRKYEKEGVYISGLEAGVYSVSVNGAGEEIIRSKKYEDTYAIRLGGDYITKDGMSIKLTHLFEENPDCNSDTVEVALPARRDVRQISENGANLLYIELVDPSIVEGVEYTGMKICPEVNVFLGEEQLIPYVDYTVSYKNNTKVSAAGRQAQIIVKGKTRFSGSRIIPFSILKADIGNVELVSTLTDAGKKFAPGKMLMIDRRTGAKVPAKEVKVSFAGGMIMEGENTVMLSATPGGNYTGNDTAIVEGSYSLPQLKVSVSGKAEFDGTALGSSVDKLAKRGITLKATVGSTNVNKQIEVIMPEDEDAKTNAGSCRFVVRYKGMAVAKSVSIKPSKNAKVEFAHSKFSVSYNKLGAVARPEDFKARGFGKQYELKYGTDYKAAYSGNKKPGNAKVKITGLGNFKGYKATLTMPVVAADLGGEDAFIYGGAVAASALTDMKQLSNAVFVCHDDVVLTKSDYEIVGTPKAVGVSDNYIVTVKGKGRYKGSVSGMIMISNGGSNDLKNAGARFVPKSKGKTAYYTNNPITEEILDKAMGVRFEVSKAGRLGVDYEVVFLNNKYKGKGIAVINSLYGGANRNFKTVKFNIRVNKLSNSTRVYE